MDKIKKILDEFDGKIYDFCYEILKYNNQGDTFEFVCKNFSNRKGSATSHIDSYFSPEEIEEYISVYGTIVNGLLESTIKKCNLNIIPPDRFYSSLWESYCSLFTTQKELAFSFYYTLIDKKIPYQYIGKPLSMSNDDFKKITEANDKYIQKIKYILNSGYAQRTERASLILNCLDEIDDYEAKVTVLAHAITLSNNSKFSQLDLDSVIKQIDQKIEELEADI